MQNAVDHAFPNRDEAGEVESAEPFDGHVVVRLDRRDGELTVQVSDDGVGLPSGFSLDASRGLGLSIVQALVTSELGGEISMHDEAGGTTVDLRVPIAPDAAIEL